MTQKVYDELLRSPRGMAHATMRDIILPLILGKETDGITYWIGKDVAREFPVATIDDLELVTMQIGFGQLEMTEHKRDYHVFKLTGPEVSERLKLQKEEASFALEAGFLAQEIEFQLDAICEAEVVEKKRNEVIIRVNNDPHSDEESERSEMIEFITPKRPEIGDETAKRKATRAEKREKRRAEKAAKKAKKQAEKEAKKKAKLEKKKNKAESETPAEEASAAPQGQETEHVETEEERFEREFQEQFGGTDEYRPEDDEQDPMVVQVDNPEAEEFLEDDSQADDEADNAEDEVATEEALAEEETGAPVDAEEAEASDDEAAPQDEEQVDEEATTNEDASANGGNATSEAPADDDESTKKRE